MSGTIRPGDAVEILPARIKSTVDRIVTHRGTLARTRAAQMVTLVLADHVDVTRGDVVCQAGQPALVSDQVQAHLVWMHEQPMLPGRRYVLSLNEQTVHALPSRPKYRLDIDTLEHVAASTLRVNEIGVCNLLLDRPVAFDPYTTGLGTGRFDLVDHLTNDTVGAGMIDFGLRRAQNLHWQDVEVDAEAHAALMGHRPAVVWLTGLSGAGKSTIANVLEKKLHGSGVHTFMLDGDNVRHGLNRDLGFTDADRVENIRRVGEVCKLMAQAGLVVIAAFISPFRAERQMVRDLFERGTFFEVFVDTPLVLAAERDPKGLYARARRGELHNFTGVDSPYEHPIDPELRVETTYLSPHDAAERIIRCLRGAEVLPGLPRL